KIEIEHELLGISRRLALGADIRGARADCDPYRRKDEDTPARYRNRVAITDTPFTHDAANPPTDQTGRSIPGLRKEINRGSYFSWLLFLPQKSVGDGRPLCLERGRCYRPVGAPIPIAGIREITL